MPVQLRFIDLFCGCGGLSYGLEKANHICVGALDLKPQAIESFNHNHKNKVGLCRDLRTYSPKEFQEESRTEDVDLIVGGPPCQGFSTAKRVGGGNNGPNVVSDTRRELYKVFLQFVEHFRPRLFVMENVLGIRSASSGSYFTNIQKEARDLQYNVACVELRCWEFGVPQSRIRQIFIGTMLGHAPFAADLYLKKTHHLDVHGARENAVVTLGEAIGDLPPLSANSGSIESHYDLALRELHFKRYGPRFTKDVLQVQDADKLTWHVARMHSERDLRDFDRLFEGETSKEALKRGVQMESPYSRETFADRYTRQHRDKLCSTIVSHLRRDGLMFIHPTQRRSLTPREVARVQSFPDTFEFFGSRGDVYEQIGNAVPPEAGLAIGLGLAEYVASSSPERSLAIQSKDQEACIRHLENLMNSLYPGCLRIMSDEEFLVAWGAVHIVKPSIHPDNALDTSGPRVDPTNGESLVLKPYYERTGWPAYLVPMAVEALERYRRGNISASDYYFQGYKSNKFSTSLTES